MTIDLLLNRFLNLRDETIQGDTQGKERLKETSWNWDSQKIQGYKKRSNNQQFLQFSFLLYLFPALIFSAFKQGFTIDNEGETRAITSPYHPSLK